MNKPYLIAVILAFFNFDVHCQTPLKLSVVDDRVSPGNILELPRKPPKTDGTYMLYDEWIEGEVVLINEQAVKRVPLKYDLYNNWLEIKTSDDVKICPSTFLSKFIINDDLGKERTFLNIRQFRSSENENLEGVFREIVSFPNKEIMLVARPYAFIKEATYVPALDMGTRNNKVIKKEAYYIISNGMYQKLPKNKKDFFKVFQEDSNKVQQYATVNKLSFKKESGIKKLLEFYDSL